MIEKGVRNCVNCRRSAKRRSRDSLDAFAFQLQRSQTPIVEAKVLLEAIVSNFFY